MENAETIPDSQAIRESLERMEGTLERIANAAEIQAYNSGAGDWKCNHRTPYILQLMAEAEQAAADWESKNPAPKDRETIVRDMGYDPYVVDICTGMTNLDKYCPQDQYDAQIEAELLAPVEGEEK